MSSAAFRPSPVILSMLSTLGSIFMDLSFCARSTRLATNSFNSGDAGGGGDMRPAAMDLRARQVQHVGGLDIREAAEH